MPPKLKPKTRLRTTGKEKRMAKRTQGAEPPRMQSIAPPPSREEEAIPTFEPANDHIDPASVIVDVVEARIPRSEVAKAIAVQAKGADAAMAIRRARAGAGAVFDVNPFDLHLEPGWNLRNFDSLTRKTSIAELALSISHIGVKETLIAHLSGDQIVVHSGWNRLLATFHAINELKAEIRGVPVRFARAGENEADRMLSQIVNNTHSDLTRIEQGGVIKKLLGFGWTEEDIALKLGKSISNVKSLLALQEMPASILRLIETDEISAYFGAKAYREAGENEEKALRVLKSAIARAKALGASRARPMHADGASRKSRSSNGGRGGDGHSRPSMPSLQIGDTPPPEPPEQQPPTQPVSVVPKIVEIIQRAQRTKVEGGGVNYLISADDHEIMMVLAHLPELDDDIEDSETQDQAQEELT